MKKTLVFTLLVVICISCGTKQVLTALEPDDEFERAMSYFENKKYDMAVQAFERVLFYHPSSEYVDDAQYWLGRTYYEKKEYDQAITEFDYLIKNFSTSRFLEEAYLYQAKSYFLKAPDYDRDPTEIEGAINLFDQFLTRFPNSKYTEEIRDLILAARNLLAKKELENGKLYIKLSEPGAALFYFNYVIDNYPETDVSYEARYHAAQILEKKGHVDKALEFYKELLEDDKWRDRIIKEKGVEILEEKANE